MMEKEISLKKGIDPRATADLVQLCSKYRSDVYIEHETKKANAKSIMGMISLSVLEEADIKLICKGADEITAIDDISAFLENL